MQIPPLTKGLRGLLGPGRGGREILAQSAVRLRLSVPDYEPGGTSNAKL